MARRVTTTKPAKTKKRVSAYQRKPQLETKKKDIAEVRLWPNANRVEGDFPLHAKAAFNEIYVEGKEKSYRVHIKIAALSLELKNIRDTPSYTPYSRYSKSAVVKSTKQSSAGSSQSTGGELGVKIGNKTLSVQLKTQAEQHNKHSSETKLENKSPVIIVAYGANLNWRIGHPDYGDPDQEGYLFSEYIEVDKPLCKLNVLPGKRKASVTATLSTRRSDMHVVREGYDATSPAISESLESDFCHHLMEKLVALRLMKDVIPTGTFILARDVLEFEPATEDDL